MWQQTVLVRDSWVGNELRVCDKARLWKNMSFLEEACELLQGAFFMHWFIVVIRKVVKNITRVSMKWQ